MVAVKTDQVDLGVSSEQRCGMAAEADGGVHDDGRSLGGRTLNRPGDSRGEQRQHALGEDGHVPGSSRAGLIPSRHLVSPSS